MSLSWSGTTATITQQNGSQATFTTTGLCPSGTWAPSEARFIATLSYSSGTWTLVRANRDAYTFNSSGQLTSETDLNGYTTTLTYSSGKLSTVTDEAGRTLAFTWTGSHITQLTDQNVSPTRSVSYGYDGSGNLASVTDVNGGITDFGYDSSHRVVQMRQTRYHSNGSLPTPPSSCSGSGTSDTVTNHYDGSGRIDCQWDANGNKTSFDYTSISGATKVTDPVGNVTVDYYNQGLLVGTTKGYGTSSAATWLFGYDPDTLTSTEVEDPNGNLSTQTVDSNGNVLTTSDPIGRTTTRTYNSLNEVLTSEDGNGVTTTYTYDSNGNLLTVSTPLVGTSATATNCKSPSTAVAIAQVTCYTYGDSSHPGDVTQITDPDGNASYFHYDSNGNRDEVKDPLGHVSGTVFNADDWPTAAYTPKANCTWNSSPPTGCSSTYETQMTYDVFGDALTVTDPLGHLATRTYDSDRNVITSEDPNHSGTTCQSWGPGRAPCSATTQPVGSRP